METSREELLTISEVECQAIPLATRPSPRPDCDTSP